MADETILVVDDHPTNLRLVVFLLEAEGYRVDIATTADEARAAIERRMPRLILMDVQLPGTGGLDLTRELRSREATRGVAIVAVTAYAMKGDREKAIDAGCDEYVTKPIDTRALPGLIRSVLDRYASAEA